MKILFLAVAMLTLGFQDRSHSAEPTSELREDVATRLIADVIEINPTGIRVATIIDGEKHSEDGFVAHQVRRVTAIHPVLIDGRMVRRVRCYDFSWNPRYGWFYQETRSSRSGEEVWIWSETEGESVVK